MENTATSHTPGFWKHYSIGIGNPDRYMGPWESKDRYMAGAFDSTSQPTTSKTICLLDPLRECEANARLIAAAPKLLDACKMLLKVLVEDCDAEEFEPEISQAENVINDAEHE